MIRSKLNFYFTRKNELLTIFDAILNRRDDYIAHEIYKLEDDYKKDKNVRADPSFIARIEQIRTRIDENKKDLQQMLEIILEEIQGEVEST